MLRYMHNWGRSLKLSYLHGDADKEKEVEFEQADDNLVPSVHRYRRIVSGGIEM
jgi:hypothetical protein